MLWLRVHSGFLDPGAPEIVDDIAVVPDVPTSVVAAPIRVPLSRLLGLLERAVPERFGSLEERRPLPDNDRVEIAFSLDRAPLSLSVDGDTATVRTTIRYGLRAWYDPPLLPEVGGSCGEGPATERPRIEVAIRAPVTLDRDWRLRTAAGIATLRPLTPSDRDRCRVTFLNLDLTDRVLEGARSFLSAHLDDIDRLASEVDVRGPVAAWWATLQEPVQLTDSLWLSMRPEAVHREEIRGRDQDLEVRLALRARPTVHYGGYPTLDTVPLPPLETGSGARGLDLRVEARVDYGAASQLLQEELRGMELSHEAGTIRLDSLRVFGVGGGRLAVEVRVSGDAAARLYLVGTPVIDPATARISVPDLDFDVATRDVVLATASWLRAVELRSLLRERAVWPATPAVEWITMWVERGLNRDLSDDLRVEGQASTVRILGAYALRDQLLVRVAIGGSATLVVGPTTRRPGDP